MGDYKLLLAGLLGSIITIIIKSIIDAASEQKQFKRELNKVVFQRKTNAVEKAMSWYQEAIDCYSMMQIAFEEIGKEENIVALAKMQISTSKANKLFNEAENRLNQIYLYYNFTAFEQKHDMHKSAQYINDGLSEILKYDKQAQLLRDAGANDTSFEIVELQAKAFSIFKGLSKAVAVQKAIIIDIQNHLREEYKSYIK